MEFIFNSIDTSKITGKTYLPIFINEALSDVYGDNVKGKVKEILKANKNSGFNTNQQIIAFIKDMLRPRTLEEIIAKGMREAYLSKMDAEKALEYATSVVDYNRQRIRRLEERLKEIK
jgi:hypothetical protein